MEKFYNSEDCKILKEVLNDLKREVAKQAAENLYEKKQLMGLMDRYEAQLALHQ